MACARDASDYFFQKNTNANAESTPLRPGKRPGGNERLLIARRCPKADTKGIARHASKSAGQIAIATSERTASSYALDAIDSVSFTARTFVNLTTDT